MSFVVAFKICTDSQVDEAKNINCLKQCTGKYAPLSKAF